MTATELQAQCELGQEQLMGLEYLQAEGTLAAAEEAAWTARDFDALARLYMPLQEARRQRRQRCGEGDIRLHLLDYEPHSVDADRIVEVFPHGQLLVAEWGSIAPAVEIRKIQAERGLYLEVFLAAVYPTGENRAVVIVPTPDLVLPPPEPMPIEDLKQRLPANCLVLAEEELPKESYDNVMDLWERLHAPFLAAADMRSDPLHKIAGYRQTIRVDYACELAHQKISDVARGLCKGRAA